MNFYVCARDFSPRHITALGYDFMPFNRRGMIPSAPSTVAKCRGSLPDRSRGDQDNDLAAKYLSTADTRVQSSSATATAACSPVKHVARHPETRALFCCQLTRAAIGMSNPHAARNFSLAGDTAALSKQAEALIAAGNRANSC